LSPGLPVIGLGALFCILSGLAAPVIEVGRIARGQSSVPSWRRVGRQFGLAVAMIAALAVTLHLVYALVAGIGSPELSPGGTVAMPSVLLGMSVGLLAALLAGAKALQLAVRTRSAHPPPPAVRATVLPRRWLLQGAGILAAAWFPLLVFGLSPLSEGMVSRARFPRWNAPLLRTSRKWFHPASASSTPPVVSQPAKPASFRLRKETTGRRLRSRPAGKSSSNRRRNTRPRLEATPPGMAGSRAR
jgi:hypothetical protein